MKGYFSLLLVTIVLISSVNFFYAGGQEQAVDALSEAEAGAASAYEAILSAEGNGGDVRELAEELNAACSLLSEARALLDEGNIDLTIERAVQSSGISTGVEVEAMALAVKAAQEAEAASRFQMVFSLVAAGMIVVVSYFAWVRFKKLYSSRVLAMRPEVAEDES